MSRRQGRFGPHSQMHPSSVRPPDPAPLRQQDAPADLGDFPATESVKRVAGSMPALCELVRCAAASVETRIARSVGLARGVETQNLDRY